MTNHFCLSALLMLVISHHNSVLGGGQTFPPVPFAASPGEECHIRVQVCQGATDQWNIGFIEINNDRIHTWKCPNDGGAFPAEGYYMAAVTASCQRVVFTGRYPNDASSFDVFTFMDSLYELLQRTPLSGYAVIASTGGYQNLRDLYFNQNDTVYSNVLSDLGLVWEQANPNYQNYLKSPGDYVDSNLPSWLRVDSDEDAIAIVARKFYPSESTYKLIGKGFGPRTIDIQVNYKDYCIQALTPLDSVMIDPQNYGILETAKSPVAAKMHIDYGNQIGCSGTVYGFEYIPANLGTPIYAGIFQYSINSGANDPVLKLIGSRMITLQGVSSDSVPQFNCFRNNPIVGVKPGYMYGYYTADHTVSVAPPIKLIYAMPFVNSKYPCSRQFTWGEGSKIFLLNKDVSDTLTTEFTYSSAINEEFVGAMALRPIMDHAFINMCSCGTDADCQMYGDYGMQCASGTCQCEGNYVYNRNSNKCTYTGIAVDKTANQSSVLRDEDINKAGGAVDNDTTAYVLNATCSKTKAGANPWWLVDMGADVNVYAVELKSLLPLDVYAEIWQVIPANANIKPDQLLVNDNYSIQTEFGYSSIQQIRINGPFPWLIESAGNTNRFILNSDYQDGQTTYTSTGTSPFSLGSVGTGVAFITRIENYGYIQTVGGLDCWALGPSNTVIKETFTAGGTCTGAVFFVEEASVSGQFAIRLLSDDRSLIVTSLVVGTQPVLQASGTTYTFTLSSFIDSATGVNIRPSNDPSFCFAYNGNNLALTNSACGTFYLKKIIDDTIPRFRYQIASFSRDTNGQEPFLYVNFPTSQITPCYEVVDTSSVYGAIINYVNGGDGIYVVAVDDAPYSNLSSIANYTDIIVRVNDVGIHDFTIGVSSYFDESMGFDASNFTKCTYFYGAPINGRNFILNCDQPVYGRYVAIYLTNGNVNEKLQLCDVKIHTLGGSIHNSICTTHADCQQFRDGGSGDQHLVCSSLTTAETVVGKCVCAFGYIFHKKAEMCVDVDECEDPLITSDKLSSLRANKCELPSNVPAIGLTNGTCVNTPGSYTCECPDGYQFIVADRDTDTNSINFGFCTDIVESQINNCGCEGTCVNGRVDQERFKFYCECSSGYKLARNGRSCEDIDECLGGPEYISAICLDNSPIGSPITNISQDYIRYCEMKCATTLNCVAVDYNIAASSCVLTSACKYIQFDEGRILYSRNTNEPRFFPLINSDCPGNTISSGSTLVTCQTDCMNNQNCVAVTLSGSTCNLKSKCSPGGDYVPGTYVYFVKERTGGLCRSLYEENVNTSMGYQPTSQCENSVGSYQCFCEDGYKYNSNLTTCLNLNECPGRCEGQCTDAIPEKSGGFPYICDCGNLPGYMLGPDNYSCIDINECKGDANVTSNCTMNSNVPSAYMYNVEPVEKYYQAFCHNRIASYYCECPRGFEWNATDFVCEDIDECTSPLHIHECEHICMNENGTYSCDCRPGYMLSLNKHSCEDVNECMDDPTLCQNATNPPKVVEGMCTNTIGSFYCSCSKGYEWRNDTMGLLDSPDTASCFDVDECVVDKPCQDQCINKYMYSDNITYQCLCNDPGFQLSNDTRTCIDIDECKDISNDCQNDTMAACQNTIGSYHCNCPTGYIWHETMKSCEDQIECNYKNGGCTDACVNVAGSYYCTCTTGYELSNNNETCEDINECMSGSASCSDKCVNGLGSYHCECNYGRTLSANNATCTDINECQTYNGGCEHICSNTVVSTANQGPPGFKCSCLPGFYLFNNSKSCMDVDECTLNTDGCSKGCMNTYGSFKCTCPIGYFLNISDNKTCSDVNECDIRNGLCEYKCINNVGSYTCTCPTGFQLWQNNVTCKDINECAQSNQDCAGEFSLCMNTPGSYRCICDRNYILSADGKRCTGPDFVEVTSFLNRAWNELYGDTSSDEYKILKAWIDSYFEAICQSLNDNAVSTCRVKGPFFPTVPDTNTVLNNINPGGPAANLLNAKIGFNIDVVTQNSLTAAQQGVISSNIVSAVNTLKNVIPINGTQVAVNALQFVYTDQSGVQRTWTITNSCDFYVQTKFCQNGATCAIVNTVPVCQCVNGFTGVSCNDIPVSNISNNDIGMLAAITGLGIFVAALTVALIFNARRRRTNTNIPDMWNRETIFNGWRTSPTPEYTYNMYK